MFNDPLERMKHLASDLVKSSAQLRFCRDFVKQELEKGNLATSYPDSIDAETVLVLTPVITAAMARLSKKVGQELARGRRKWKK